jgi:hypothetical protein
MLGRDKTVKSVDFRMANEAFQKTSPGSVSALYLFAARPIGVRMVVKKPRFLPTSFLPTPCLSSPVDFCVSNGISIINQTAIWQFFGAR